MESDKIHKEIPNTFTIDEVIWLLGKEDAEFIPDSMDIYVPEYNTRYLFIQTAKNDGIYVRKPKYRV